MKSPGILTADQRGGINFLLSRPNSALFADMGSGKSVTTLSAVDKLLDTFRVARILVVAPLRVARKVWSDEVADWSHLSRLTIATAIGTENERLYALNQKTDITTINRENLQWLETLFVDENDKQIRRWPWDWVVLDESQSYKTWGSKRARVLRRLRKFFPRCTLLTGTPAPNGYEDLFAQIYLLDQGKRLGKTKTAFLKKYFIPPQDYLTGKWVPRAGATEEINAKIADLVYVMRDPNPLVPVTPIRVDLGPKLLAEYKQFERETVMHGGDIRGVNGGVLAGKLLQFANGAVYKTDGDWVDIHDHKIKALMELLEDAQGPVMVPYAYRHDRARIKKALAKTKLRWRELDTKQDEYDWNAGLIDVLLLHPKSAGHGLNLQFSGSELIIWYGLTYSLEDFQQTNARLTGGHRRTGRSIRILAIVADGTRDARMLGILSAKGATQDDMKDALQEMRPVVPA